MEGAQGDRLTKEVSWQARAVTGLSQRACDHARRSTWHGHPNGPDSSRKEERMERCERMRLEKEKGRRKGGVRAEEVAHKGETGRRETGVP